MLQSRREFLIASAGASAALVSGSALGGLFAASRKPMKILFLGGTGFLGPAAVELLAKAGHEVTLFNRGKRDELFPDLEQILGNRIVTEEPGLAPLKAEIDKGRRWDAVVDTANVHTWVDHSAALLKGSVDHYVFISSLSAYADTSGQGRKEEDAVATMPDDIADGIDRLPYDMTYFGAVKARCEAAAERHFPGRATVLRPGLIVGPRDFSHRFTYWPWRVRQGGEVLAPGNASDPVQFIDVRDVGAFIVRVIEQRAMGIFNVNGPAAGGMTIGGLLDACKGATASDASFTWVDADFLAERQINGWAQMPVWLPPVGETEGFHRTSIERALAAGLSTRPLGETVRDTLAWFDAWLPEIKESRGYEYKPGENAPGVSREQEARVLEEWKQREG
jgi:2'-hydroxyisoflavone reductase